MLKAIFLALALIVFALPVAAKQARPPEVVDHTQDTTPPPEEEVKKVLSGTIKAACAPWKDGVALGVELEQHIGITVYASLDMLKERLGTEFKAGADMREAGSAVIFRCDENDANCQQLAGSVTFNATQSEAYYGTLKIESEEPKKFVVKRIPSTAKCDG